MENKPAGKWKAPFGNSITRRYATGYILITAIAVVLFLVSFFSGRMLSSRYELAVNDLLELNNLFVRVEDTNRVVFDYYFYLRPLSGQQYYQDAAKTREQLEDIQAHMDASYSREVMDLCCIVDTFLQKTDQLVANVTVFRSEGGTGNRTALAAAYSETQQILGFISQSFQDVYISKLETTSRMQTQLMQIQRILYIVQISMLILAVATSIDALAVGVTFAFLNVQILPAVSLIGVTTFVLSAVGVRVGNVFGSRYKSKAELAGGIILVLMGVKILLEHLGILG